MHYTRWGLFRPARTRQVVCPLLERPPHLPHVAIAVVDRGDTAIGVSENALDELVALVSEALSQAGCNRATQIMRGELLGKPLAGDRQDLIKELGPVELRDALNGDASVGAREEVLAVRGLRNALEDLNRLGYERHHVHVIALVCPGRDDQERLVEVHPSHARGRPRRRVAPVDAPSPRAPQGWR
jgi:hypothetical protein